jgi:glucosyl-dolichyl phosphate glucuronosyltransferase
MAASIRKESLEGDFRRTVAGRPGKGAWGIQETGFLKERPMHITVILCTYNRAHSLLEALRSVAASSLPPSVAWEVLIVDNNSRDNTREIAQEFCRQCPDRFRYIFEPQQGKSFALNSGIRQSQGDVLAFMDDDVTVEPTWLYNLTHALESNEWSGAGGRIILEWPASIPYWLTTDGPYARHGFPGFDQGREAKELVGPPFGTNMAFLREVFVKHGGFRTDLGPNPGSQIRAEDTEFGRRLIQAGERLRYEPDAVVHHPVPADKLNKRHILKWWYDNGRGVAREFDIRPFVLTFRLLSWAARWMSAFEPRQRFYRKLVVWEKYGMLSEFWRQWLGARKHKNVAMQQTKRAPII